MDRSRDTALIAIMGSLFDDGARPGAAEPYRMMSEAGHMALLRRASLQQVGPLAARRLLTERALAGEAAAEAERMVRDNVARNLFLRSETELWRDRLRGAGVPCRTLKGVAWSTLLFGDPGARTCSDIDLLVRPEDVGRAMRVAADAGFLPGPSDAVVPDDDRKEVHLRPRLGPGLYDLDLHWRLEPRRLVPLDHEDLWPPCGSNSSDSGDGRDAAEVPPDWVGALMCLNLWRHGATLKTLVDFTAFATRYEATLPAVRERLRRAEASEGLDLALGLAERAFNVHLRRPGPRSIRRALLPLLERCLMLPQAERGRYFCWLVLPLQFDGLLRPLGRLGAHVVRPGVRGDGRLLIGSRLGRLTRAAGRAVFRGGRLIARREPVH